VTLRRYFKLMVALNVPVSLGGLVRSVILNAPVLDTSAVVDNPRRLNAILAQARREIDERERVELGLFTAERLVEASLRYR
jgi:hypothetical protein